MKLNDSNKRISKIIAGILLVFVALSFIAIALGIEGYHLYSQDKMDPLNSVSQFNLEDYSSEDERSPSGDIGYIDFVPVDQDCFGGNYHTEPGEIKVVAEELLDGNGVNGLDEFFFPLCFDPSYDIKVDFFIYNWFKIFEVCGDYTPIDCCSYFNIYQNKVTGWDEIGYVNPCGYNEWIGWKLHFIELSKAEIVAAQTYEEGIHTSGGRDYNVSSIDTSDDCCCTSYWIAIIDASCNNGACIASDQWPTGCEPNEGFIPDKHLTVWLNMTWTGCDSSAQNFDLILVQILRILNSRINI